MHKDGHTMRFCKVCKKETFHYIITNESLRAYLCRSCELKENAK